jgi:hypothetical protein
MAKRQAEEVAVHLSQDFDAFYHQPLDAVAPSIPQGRAMRRRSWSSPPMARAS